MEHQTSLFQATNKHISFILTLVFVCPVYDKYQAIIKNCDVLWVLLYACSAELYDKQCLYYAIIQNVFNKHISSAIICIFCRTAWQTVWQINVAIIWHNKDTVKCKNCMANNVFILPTVSLLWPFILGFTTTRRKINKAPETNRTVRQTKKKRRKNSVSASVRMEGTRKLAAVWLVGLSLIQHVQE